jgi:DNA-binding transcriptional regulator LsrR (DeoR family)
MVKNETHNRDDLLADVAEMYYLDGMNQSEISKRVGVTRSMISRMLTEARNKNIVKISIDRDLQYSQSLSKEMITRYKLLDAMVFIGYVEDSLRYLSRLGSAAAKVIKPYLKSGLVLGTAWGTALGATINALEVEHPMAIKVVQLVGALRGRNLEIDGHGVVGHLAAKVGGEAHYLNVPYIVDSPETVDALMKVTGVRETMQLMKQCDVGLFGVGSTNLDYSTFYSAGYLIGDEIEDLIKSGAVGNVCGLFFDKDGNQTARNFQKRSFTIRKRDLMKIPIRIGIAGGPGKIEAVRGALAGGYINVLVTDNHTAAEVLNLE